MPEIEENRLSLIGYPFPEIKRVEEIFSTLKSDAALLEEAKRRVLHGAYESQPDVQPVVWWRTHNDKAGSRYGICPAGDPVSEGITEQLCLET